MQQKTFLERIVHAVCFEIIAIALTAPLFSWLIGRSLVQIGALSVLLSTLAMGWNIIYNALFDRLWPPERVKRNVKVRMFHALGFEGGFIVFGVTLVMLFLQVNLVTALMMEIGFFLFFLPYTYFYNLAWDSLRARWVRYRRKKAAKRVCVSSR